MNLETIDDAKKHFIALGYHVSEWTFFSERTLFIGNKSNDNEITVLENAVFLYNDNQKWIVHKAPHGQDHLITEHQSLSEAINECLEKYLTKKI